MSDIRLTLKVVINKQKTKVLFAEVYNDFADVLFSFLILPLGKIVYALEKHYGDKTPHVIGSLTTLHHALVNLHNGKCQFYGRKPSFLNPESAYGFPFLDQTFSSDHTSYTYPLGEAYFVVLKVFTEQKASFLICDDLRIVPNGNGSILRTLNILGVDMADIDGAETRIVTFGVNEIMDFLKGLLTSRQPLTDIILGKSGTSLPHIEKETTPRSPMVIYNLKVMYQKSTNKLLFAQVDKDFVSYIATVLTVPLGMIDLGVKTCFNKLHPLYRSLGDLINHKHLKGAKKHLLMNPETIATMYPDMDVSDILNVVEGSRLYMVTDDLTIKPLCLFSAMSLLKEMNLSASDVDEVEFNIGLDEVQNILKASLTSRRAFSDGLNNPKFMKRRRRIKQER